MINVQINVVLMDVVVQFMNVKLQAKNTPVIQKY